MQSSPINKFLERAVPLGAIRATRRNFIPITHLWKRTATLLKVRTSCRKSRINATALVPGFIIRNLFPNDINKDVFKHRDKRIYFDAYIHENNFFYHLSPFVYTFWLVYHSLWNSSFIIYVLLI